MCLGTAHSVSLPEAPCPPSSVSIFATMLDHGDSILRGRCAVRKDSNLWPAPGSPGRWSCGATSPVPGCHHSFSGRFCCHRWPSHIPSFSRLRRHYGGLPSSDGPAGPPGAGCLLVSLSARAQGTTFALESKLSLFRPKQVFLWTSCYS